MAETDPALGDAIQIVVIVAVKTESCGEIDLLRLCRFVDLLGFDLVGVLSIERFIRKFRLKLVWESIVGVFTVFAGPFAVLNRRNSRRWWP